MTSKITDEGYFLPNVLALEGHSTFESGANQPMLIRGLCETTGNKGEYVIKYRGGERMSNEASARELLGAFIARELNLNVVEPVIVNIIPEFIDTLKGRNEHFIANKSIGLNYGSRYLTGKLELQSPMGLSDKLLMQALNIFAFDIFISNADRTHVNNKQNMFTDGNNIVLFDHELAFGFIFDMPFLRKKEPWVINEMDMRWVKNHYFYHALKGRGLCIDGFVANFDSLNDSFWEKCKATIPSEWLTDQVNEIEDYLGKIVNNHCLFVEELRRILL